MTGLEFYPSSHRYKLDGQWVQGVTTIIKQGLPNGALMYWSAKTVAEWVADHPDGLDQLRSMGRGPLVQALKEVPWERRDSAAVNGTDVHALAEQLVAGQEVDVPGHLTGYVESCVQFLDQWKPRPVLVEPALFHRTHQWAGTADLFACLPSGDTVLFDYKTSRSGVWPETAFQLAAYSHAEHAWVDGQETDVPEVDWCAAVWLRPDGYDVIPVNASDQVYGEFLQIKAVADAAKRAKGSKTALGYVGLPKEIAS